MRIYVLFCFSLLLLTSCENQSKAISKATGTRINSKGGFQYNIGFKGQESGPGLVFIEGGTFTMGSIQDDVMLDWDNIPISMHVQSFYMDETEVTNLMYVEYLDWLKKVFPPSDLQYRDIYLGAVPDTLVWRSSLGYNEDMVTNYLRHPAFAEYPVVGVSWLQASQFCKWRTNRVNEIILEREGYLKKGQRNEIPEGKQMFDVEAYLAAPQNTFGGSIDSLQGKRKKDSINVFANIGTGVILPNYRLPTEIEWEYAAGSFKGKREYNNTKGKNKYPWTVKYTRSGDFKTLGDQLANFKQGKGDYGGVAGWSDDKGDITVKVKTYPPNDFGLYDMAGNVAEWVADVYRDVIDDKASDFNYFRGNVFLEPKIGEDGVVITTELDNIEKDTLQNGKIIATNLPGQVKKQDMNIRDTSIRSNFSRSDNKDFKDGDTQSSRMYRASEEELLAEDSNASSEGNDRMYKSPVNEVGVDSTGSVYLIPDKSLKRTTLVDNKVRVYKGGSWKDRAYWLDPGKRRFFPEYLATSFIGFRCAMSRVGQKYKIEKKPRDK